MRHFTLVGMLFLLFSASAFAMDREEITLARDGEALMPIIAVPSDDAHAPANELKHYLDRITGGTFEIIPAAEGPKGIFVGTAADFPWLPLDAQEIQSLGIEGFILRTDGTNLLLIGKDAKGTQHAVQTFLYALGCRWFFPGETWEVIPSLPTITGRWDQMQKPSFTINRNLWYGFGSYPRTKNEKDEWDRHNRMGSAIPMSIGHTSHGLTDEDFWKRPELFALVKGKRVQGSKPCYSHPEFIERMKNRALKAAAEGAKMISLTPADGLNYCECDLCRAWAKGGDIYWDKGSQFATRPDGVIVSITSETVFHCINEVAKAVAQEYPDVLLSTYAYSSYAHPPTFKLEPNIFIQTTTAFRRTPKTLEQQLATLKELGVQSGIRGYWAVYQWDWDYPDIKGELSLPRMVNDLRFYYDNNVRSFNTEASNNWGPRGLNYYLGAHLLWDINADVSALLTDFYDKSFGPAQEPMKRYYARWLGQYALPGAHWDELNKNSGTAGDESDSLREMKDAAISALSSAGNVGNEVKEVLNELGALEMEPFSVDALRGAYRDLDEAASLVRDMPEYRDRVDQIRMYTYYLFLRTQLEKAAKTGDKDAIVAAIRDETVFGARLMNTNMIHTRPLIGKAFHRRFKPYMKYLKGMPEGEGKDGWGKGFRATRTDVPTHEELEALWAQSKAELGL